MRVLLLGSGGREHAIAWKIAQSSQLDKLFIAPGNAGTRNHGTNVAIQPTDFEAIKTFVLENEIATVVVGPEDPLVKGIYDFFQADATIKHVNVIGPSKEAAQLEGSKDFAKKFMQRHNIPTAKYATFTKDTLEEGYAFLSSMKPPYVLKADGLAAGKGVVIPDTLAEAKAELKSMLADAKFGDASSRVVIEQFLKGIELSVFVLTDGESYKILPEAKDYKRIGEGDTGLNTGGMGAVSPVVFADNVIEYNCRMGDPETEVVMPRIKSDILDLFEGIATGTLSERDVQFDERAATTVMMVAGGYPEEYQKGKTIHGLNAVKDSIVFHAGTSSDGPVVLSSGGRVLAVTSYGKTIEGALNRSYSSIEGIEFEGANYRKDIGRDLINYTK